MENLDSFADLVGLKELRVQAPIPVHLIPIRATVMTLLKELASTIGIKNKTLMVSLKYIDFLLGFNKYKESVFKLLSVIALNISCKINHDKILTLGSIISYLNLEISQELYVLVELKVIQDLSWEAQKACCIDIFYAMQECSIIPDLQDTEKKCIDYYIDYPQTTDLEIVEMILNCYEKYNTNESLITYKQIIREQRAQNSLFVNY